MDIKIKFKEWSNTQRELRDFLEKGTDVKRGLQLFHNHHAVLHSRKAFPDSPWSYEDLIFEDLTDEQARTILTKFEHSIAWNIWHLARIEDITMNILVADDPQIFSQDNWFEKLNTPFKDCGFGMELDDIKILSKIIDIQALRDYRAAVARKTRLIVQNLESSFVGSKVKQERLQRVVDEDAVGENREGLLEYWGNRTIAGILLMPPTRHCMVHLNESMEIKKKLTSS